MLNKVCAIVSVAALVFAAGCGGGASVDAVRNGTDPVPVTTTTTAAADAGGGAVAPRASSGKGEPYDAAKATCVIKGVVTWDGKIPKMSEIDITEPICKADHGDKGMKRENIVVSDDRKVENVVVYVSDGYQKYNFDNYTLPPAKFNQKGCQYLPHVLAMKVDQSLEIQSSDPVAHNIHIVPSENPESNFSQPTPGFLGSKPRYSTPEMGIPVKCDVHGWMNAWICVFEHPFFAVTNADGTFEIKLPPGNYTISAWQEQMASKKFIGPAPKKVDVTADKPAEVDFTFKGK